MGSLALSRVEALDRPAPSISDEVTRIARQELAPLAADIDSGTVYPDALLRSLGKVGAWSSHVPQEGPADLRWAIQSMAAIGEVCGATAFMAWCQNTLVWYVANSTNIQLAQRFGDCFSSGRRLGGTGLPNPMKTFFGIEKFKLKGRKVEGGYIVKGALPWVSNLGADHFLTWVTSASISAWETPSHCMSTLTRTSVKPTGFSLTSPVPHTAVMLRSPSSSSSSLLTVQPR